MKKTLALLLISLFSFSAAWAQSPTYQDDDQTAESFGTFLKDQWTFTRDLVDQLNKETETKGEFETTPEFQTRVAQTRQVYAKKLEAHLKDVKLNQRVFGVWFKAQLVRYSADSAVYHIQSPTTVEAPYDLPTVECTIPTNPYVELADSIRGGYRTSSIQLKFKPDFIWKTERREALQAKDHEGTIYFKVHFVVSITQDKSTTQAEIKITPKDIALMNQANKFVFWKAELQQ